MTLKVDKAGRVLLPKLLRTRLGLHAGSDLDIQETAGGFMVTPLEKKSSLIQKGNFLVYAGEVPPNYDVLQAIDQDREEQARKAWGL